MQKTATEARIEALLLPALEHSGLSIVQIKHDGASGNRLLVLLERIDGVPITLDECSDASVTISALLDVEDPISSHYELEVSSAGMDRPLTKLEDFKRFIGKEAKLSLRIPVEAHGKISGTIESVEGELIQIKNTSDGQMFDIEYSNIEKARLKVSDKLFNNHKTKHKKKVNSH